MSRRIMSRWKNLGVVLLATMMLSAVVTPAASAADSEEALDAGRIIDAVLLDNPMSIDLSTYDGADTPSAIVEFPSDESLQESVTYFGLTGESRVVVKQDRSVAHGRGLVQPQFSVGLGWYIYVYLNRGDWNHLVGLGAGGAATALCRWLAPTLKGALACFVASYIVITFVFRLSAPPSGYCREFKFTYQGHFAGTKLVKRSC